MLDQGLRSPGFRAPPPSAEFRDNCRKRTRASVEFEDPSNPNSLFFVDDQTAAAGSYVVAEHRCPSYPFAFAPCRRHLVPRTFPDDLALELRTRQYDVERATAER